MKILSNKKYEELTRLRIPIRENPEYWKEYERRQTEKREQFEEEKKDFEREKYFIFFEMLKQFPNTILNNQNFEFFGFTLRDIIEIREYFDKNDIKSIRDLK